MNFLESKAWGRCMNGTGYHSSGQRPLAIFWQTEIQLMYFPAVLERNYFYLTFLAYTSKHVEFSPVG